MVDTDQRTDVVVVGAGMAGLSAAVQAAEDGADVILLEKGKRAGGSTLLSGGVLYTFDSFEGIRDYAPHGDPELQKLVVEQFEDGIDWLKGHGAEIHDYEFPTYGPAERDEVPPEGEYKVDDILSRYTTGYRTDTSAFTAHMLEVIEDYGGEIYLETAMTELITEDDEVVGVVARNSDDEKTRIGADGVVLATGGFQGNEELVEQFMTDTPENLWLRANPWSTGDGLLAAKEVGAKTTKGMGRFYGHTMVAPPAEFSPHNFPNATAYYGPWAIALDGNGRRFTDESESPEEETVAQDAAKHADGRVFYVLDNELYESSVHLGSVKTMVDQQMEMGGRTAEVESLEALREVLSEWGVDGGQAIDTITSYNEAVRNGRADELEPPREHNQLTHDTPPFYAIETQSGITFSMGGLDVNTDMEVLRRTNSNTSIPQYAGGHEDAIESSIPGLYATGVDIGRIHYRRTVGPLASCLVTGRIAGRNAAAR